MKKARRGLLQWAARGMAGPPTIKKRIQYGAGMRQRMLQGALQVSRAVTLTLGPGGRLVMLQGLSAGQEQDPFSSLNAKELQVTKDGVTVARAL